MKILCDKCDKDFETTQITLKEHTMADGLIEVYFLCPRCRAKHHVCWHNSETKNLQKLIKKAENTGDKEKAMEYRTKLKTCMDRLNNRL